MVALRTGFQLIITADLPRGQHTGENRSKLKVKLVERLFFYHAWHIFDRGERRRREVILEVFDK